MSTLAQLQRKMDSIDASAGEFCIEDFVLSQQHIRPGETHEQTMLRLHPSKVDTGWVGRRIAQCEANRTARESEPMGFYIED